MKQPVAACLFFLVLAACSSFAQPTSATIPTLAPTVPPPTETSDVVLAVVLEDQPAVTWEGIPIMPGATAREGDEEGYVFRIKTSLQKIRDYYQFELSKLGLQPLSQGTRDSSILMFTNNTSETLTIHILSKDDEALVLLVK